MPEISPQTKKLIQQYQYWYQSLQSKEQISTIHVDEVATAVATFYEKIRGIIEWREEHLLRKSAIARVLKRRLAIQETAQEIAEPLVLELIRAGHFPNDQIDERKIEEIKNVLYKYLFILKKSSSPPKEKIRVELYDWLLNISACEIEEILTPSLKELALIEYMAELMKERTKITVTEGNEKKEIEKKIYIAIQRALFKFDNSTISLYLLKRKYSNWSNLSQDQLQEITNNIYLIWNELEKDLNCSLSEKLYQVYKKQSIPYLILGDIIENNLPDPFKILSQSEILEKAIKDAYQKRFIKLKGKLKRAAFYSVISIFITKILVALAIEIPFDKYVLNYFNYQALGFNILIPPFLMFLLVSTIRPPKKENLNKIIIEVMKIVYKTEKKDIYIIKSPKKKGFVLAAIIGIFYILTFILSFGIIIFILNKLKFSVLSIIIFLMFFCLIFFAGIKIRERTKELTILPEKSGFLAFLIDTFSLPFLRMGRWLSNKLTKYNIVLIFINILIDLPFQLFTEFLEHWRNFLKEKKEEIH